VLLTPLLAGLDGVEKMSKSLGNYIGITDPPNEMYGKAMSIPDALIPTYLEYVTDVPMDEVRSIAAGQRDGSVHPRDAKRRLARGIVEVWHGAEAAGAAEAEFDRVIVGKDMPDEIPEAAISKDDAPDGQIKLTKLLVVTGLAESNREARRLISQGGVTIDAQRHNDIDAVITVRAGMVIKVGARRYVRVNVS
jgi:tyrosyl-tRNA synthetase